MRNHLAHDAKNSQLKLIVVIKMVRGLTGRPAGVKFPRLAGGKPREREPVQLATHWANLSLILALIHPS